jgi:hypothetical protein
VRSTIRHIHETHRLRSLLLPWNNKRPSSKHKLSQRIRPVPLKMKTQRTIGSRQTRKGRELATTNLDTSEVAVVQRARRVMTYLNASGWQLEQALHGLPPEALCPLGVHQLPHPVLRETKPQSTGTLSQRTNRILQSTAEPPEIHGGKQGGP